MYAVSVASAKNESSVWEINENARFHYDLACELSTTD